MKRAPRIAIVGRPNVGKSTLFNRITGKRRAIVHPTPGVTRDVQRMVADWNGVGFELTDTGGLFSGIKDDLIQAVEHRAMEEALHADVLIFVTDATAGITAGDREVAERIRQIGRPVVVAVNKCEKETSEQAAGEFFALGFESVFTISALHGQGVGDLLDEVVKGMTGPAPGEPETSLKLALIGKPNVGKSSLINALVGAEASIVDSRPGTTRDSVDLHVRWHGRDVTLVDTAGINRQSRSRDGLTSITALKSIDTVSRADVVAMVLDASQSISNQDVKVASYAHRAGKGLFFAVNKWDLVTEKTNRTVPEFEREIKRAFAFAAYAPVIFVSALSGQRVHRILETAWAIGETRTRRVSTSELNKYVGEAIKARPAPYYGGGTGKIYYATQTDVAPPTFVLFVNRRAFFSRSYLRYINNQLRRNYG